MSMTNLSIRAAVAAITVMSANAIRFAGEDKVSSVRDARILLRTFSERNRALIARQIIERSACASR